MKKTEKYPFFPWGKQKILKLDPWKATKRLKPYISLKHKNYNSSKDPTKRVKKHVTDWKKIFVMHISNEVLPAKPQDLTLISRTHFTACICNLCLTFFFKHFFMTCLLTLADKNRNHPSVDSICPEETSTWPRPPRCVELNPWI